MRPAAPPLYPVRAPGRFARVPASVQLIAWLFLFGAACALLIAITPMPLFALGCVISGPAGRAGWVGVAVVQALCGYGLLTLREWGRRRTFALLALASVNVLIALTPRSLRNLNVYLEQVLQAFHLPQSPAFAFHYTAATMLPSTVLGIMIYSAAAWYLHKHRAAFTQKQSAG